jgi:hypothetical protein
VSHRTDALLDAYADRGKAIDHALRLVDDVLNAPVVDHRRQQPLRDFAQEIRTALQPKDRS